MERIAIYPGTFDPLTLGHFDLALRSAGIFDHIVLAVAESTPKSTLFTLEERLTLTRDAVAGIENVEVDTFNGLLIDYLRSRGARVLIRGVRAFTDFEYEFQMALINRKLDPDIETLFMMPDEANSYVSSSRIKEVAALGGDVARFLPDNVASAVKAKYSKDAS
jgi:pantetheine-phosphate adenylyltransferase